jgi:hypothetical protein
VLLLVITSWAVARGRQESQLTDLVCLPKTNAANERLAQHLWAHRDDLFTFLRQQGWTPPTGVQSWRSALGSYCARSGGGSWTWAGARARSVLMSVWRTCWQQGRCALDFLSQFLRGGPVTLALPRDPPRPNPCTRKALVPPSTR